MMNLEKWKSGAELVGILAIFGSLVFVGFQLQQDRQIAQAQLAMDYELKQTELSNLISQDASVWVKGLNGDVLSEDEEAVFETIVHALSVKYDATYDRAQTQFGTRGAEGIARQLAMHIYSHKGFRRVWERRCEYLKGIDGSDIPPCARVRAELAAIDNGTAPKPAGKIWSP